MSSDYKMHSRENVLDEVMNLQREKRNKEQNFNTAVMCFLVFVLSMVIPSLPVNLLKWLSWIRIERILTDNYGECSINMYTITAIGYEFSFLLYSLDLSPSVSCRRRDKSFSF